MQLPSTSKPASVLYQGLRTLHSSKFHSPKIMTMKYLPLWTEGKIQGSERWKGAEANGGGAECSKDKGQKQKTTIKAEPRTYAKDPYKVFLISGSRSFPWTSSQTTSPVSLISQAFRGWILSTSSFLFPLLWSVPVSSSGSLKFKECVQLETQDWYISNVWGNKPSVLWMDIWMRQWVKGKMVDAFLLVWLPIQGS